MRVYNFLYLLIVVTMFGCSSSDNSTSSGAGTDPASPCTSCLVAATYCAGIGQNGIRVSVTDTGSVTVVHPVGSATVSVDQCSGGEFSISIPSANNFIAVSGSIPCGITDSITITEDDGQNPPKTLIATQSAC